MDMGHCPSLRVWPYPDLPEAHLQGLRLQGEVNKRPCPTQPALPCPGRGHSPPAPRADSQETQQATQISGGWSQVQPLRCLKPH